MSTKFDAIVIGTGQSGPPLAERLAQAGQRVAVIERKHFGGTCVNTGCIPTKALIASAHAAHLARRVADYYQHRRPRVHSQDARDRRGPLPHQTAP